jgi:hypothetical protein
MRQTWKSLMRRLEVTARGALRPGRAIGLLAVLATVAGSFALATAPAEARIRDSVWMTMSPNTSTTVKVTATTNISPTSTFIELDNSNGSELQICANTTTCSVVTPIGPSYYTAYVWAYSYGGGWQTLIATATTALA